MIKIYNDETKEFTYVNSIYEIPFGWRRFKNFKKSTRQKMSESAKKRGTPECAFRNKSGKENPMYGKTQSESAKDKISKTKKERAETIKNYGLKGKKAYYDKDTLKIKYFSDDETIPDNYIKGRPPKDVL